MAFFAIIVMIVSGVIWGAATQAVVSNKGYTEKWFWWGFFFGFIALIVALSKPENHGYYRSYEGSTYVSAADTQRRERAMLANNGWKCRRCGQIHPNYSGTCGCGNTRQNDLDFAVSQETEKKKTQDKASELENLEKLKAYKDLLDSEVISQEEFDKKKKQLLNL